MTRLDSRLQRYYRIRSKLTRESDERLVTALDALPSTTGWGRNVVLDLGRDKIFVKRILVTDLEMKHQRSTRNLYRLPTYYNYGMWSAGFGVNRELLSHIKTTDWVLEGAHERFPLMFDYRIVPRRDTGPQVFEDLDEYVTYWNNSRRVGHYIEARTNVRHEAIVFREYFPHTLASWLPRREDRLGWMVEQTLDTVRFLQSRGIIHFDVHAGNLVTDGECVFLIDFGLVLDRDFELSDAERQFWQQHRRYDEATLLFELSAFLAARFMNLGTKQRVALAQRYDLDTTNFGQIAKTISDNLEEIVELGLMKLLPETVELIVRYRPIVDLMATFFLKMRSGSKKTYPFEHRKLSRLLNAALG